MPQQRPLPYVLIAFITSFSLQLQSILRLIILSVISTNVYALVATTAVLQSAIVQHPDGSVCPCHAGVASQR